MRAVVLVVAVVACAEPVEDEGERANAIAHLQLACEDYVAAMTACSNEAFGESSTTEGLSGLCDDYAGLSGPAATFAHNYLRCITVVYEDADCSTPEGYEEATAVAAGCG